MHDESPWQEYFMHVELYALEGAQKLLDDYEAPLNDWVQGMLSGPLPADWRDELARFVEWTHDFGPEFSDESLAEIERILQKRATASVVAVGDEADSDVDSQAATTEVDGAAATANSGQTARTAQDIRTQITYIKPTPPVTEDGLPAEIKIAAFGLDPAKTYVWLQFFAVRVFYENADGRTVPLTGAFTLNFGNNRQSYDFGKEYIDNRTSGWKYGRQERSADGTSKTMIDHPTVATKSRQQPREFLKLATRANNGITPPRVVVYDSYKAVLVALNAGDHPTVVGVRAWNVISVFTHGNPDWERYATTPDAEPTIFLHRTLTSEEDNILKKFKEWGGSD